MLSSTARQISLLLALGAAALTQAHFILETPQNIGFDDDTQDDGPCGGFNASSRTSVTNFPVSGGAVEILTTHETAVFEFRAALLKDLDHWRTLTPLLNITGSGKFCESSIPGVKEWVGQDAVLQVVQHDMDERLHQCAAIKFVAGAGDAVPASRCLNDTGLVGHWVAGM